MGFLIQLPTRDGAIPAAARIPACGGKKEVKALQRCGAPNESRSIVEAITENPKESRKEWLLEQFKKAGTKASNTKNYQFWRHDNKPVELWSNKVIDEKISYIHNNPVDEGLVHKPEDYLYSSARDYAGEKGYLNDVIVVQKWSY